MICAKQKTDEEVRVEGGLSGRPMSDYSQPEARSDD
jgi:hypothetical protein